MMKANFFPIKSVAGALLFSVFLGPVGLLYSSVIGGIVLLVLSFIAVSGKFFVAFALFWLSSSVWSVIAVNRYNKKMYCAIVEP